MKNNLFVAITFIWTLTGNAHALNETEQIEQMAETLQKQGLTGFMETVRSNQWDAPRIPSKWFVDSRITNDEEKRRAAIARDFGYQLAVQLDKLAQEQQTLPPANVLFQRSILLCDAGDWCTKTVGYGNIFLAQRCLDLAAVGLARLTASLEFPIVDCERLAAKTHPEWQGMAYRLRVLNGEAETNLFINANVTGEQLDWQWAIGWTLREDKEKKKTLVGFVKNPDPGIVNVRAVTNNLDFFVENQSPLLPFTLLRSWDCRRHRIIAMGLGLQTVDKALGLLDFRKVIGFFPNEFVRSEEEWHKLREEIKEAAKWGAKITPEEESPSYDPLEEAFRRAWLNRPNRKNGDQDHYGTAFRAYKDVRNGQFLDRDTDQVNFVRKCEETKRERRGQVFSALGTVRQRGKLDTGYMLRHLKELSEIKDEPAMLIHDNGFWRFILEDGATGNKSPDCPAVEARSARTGKGEAGGTSRVCVLCMIRVRWMLCLNSVCDMPSHGRGAALSRCSDGLCKRPAARDCCPIQ